MQQSEAHGLTSSFYFVWDEQMPNLMPNIKLSTALLEICYLRYALEHEIGLHPSYNSYMDQDAIYSEAKRLQKVCAEENIKQEIFFGGWGR